MNGWTIALVLASSLVMLGVSLAIVVGYYRVKHSIRLRIAHEKAVGNTRLRRRMENLAGRRTNPETMRYVGRAETMRGWVWIVTTNMAGSHRTEMVGWAPTRRTARRALERHTTRRS